MSRRLRLSSALLAVIIAGPALADMQIVQRSKSDGLPALGQPAKESTTTTWVGENKMCQQDDNNSTILDLENKKMFIVQHQTKSYSAVDLPIDYEKVAPQLAQMMKQNADMMKIAVEITPTDDKKEINGFPSRRYDVSINAMGMQMSVRLWTTTAIDFDASEWKRLAIEMTSIQPMVGDITKKMMEIEGFPVYQESTVSVMGNEIKSTEELISVENAKPPAGIYSPPEGYQEKPFDPMALMNGQ